ncbi:DUF4336 domain-containing protein [Rhizobium leguminosarum]|uniref:DUF4336 domain-containing protein n=1 Tax=Rhizobium leguminosarum TaxID=384 RepID=UPI001C910D52|nr:DUF4336 domain-containing protein [Rhizobium leguminosarum]
MAATVAVALGLVTLANTCSRNSRRISSRQTARTGVREDWKGRFPEASPAQRRQAKKARISWHGDLGDASRAPWTADIDQIEVPGMGGLQEVCFFYRKSQTLVVTDLIQNLDDHQQSSWTRLFSSLVGAQERAPVSYRLPLTRDNLQGLDARIPPAC